MGQRWMVCLTAMLVFVLLASGSSSAVATKPARDMTTLLHHHPLQLRVKVAGYPSGPTYLQKKTCARCQWANIDHKTTTDFGRVRYRLHAPRTGNWYYRVMTPERPHFRESYSRVAKTFRH